MKNVNLRKLVTAFALFYSVAYAIEIKATLNPPISPSWVLGHIVWEDSLNTQTGVLSLVDGYLERGIGVSGVIIDSPWSTSYNDFNWNLERYPNPHEMAEDLKKRNVKPIIWLTGVINSTCTDVPVDSCETYNYVKEHGYAVNEGKPSTWWKGTGIQVDFTNEEAKLWWYSQLDKVFEDFYGFKVDQAEVVFGDTIHTSRGKMSISEFKKYYYDSMFDYVTDRKPQTGIIYARPYSYQGKGYCASINKLSIGWCGDFEGHFPGLIKQIGNIYQSALSGYAAVGCEIGGFSGARSTGKELVRYSQFASMTACMINGGMNGPFSCHLPWWHSDSVFNAYKYCATLHNELVPYIFSNIVDCHLHGGTLLNSCSMDTYSHILGDCIYTKAIVNGDDEGDFILPSEGEWMDFFTGEILKGGEIIWGKYDIDKFPLYIKMGAVIPLHITNDITGNGTKEMAGKKVVAIYPSSYKDHIYKKIHWPENDGIDYIDIQISYDNGILNVLSDKRFDFVFQLHNYDEVNSIEGSNDWSYDKKRKILSINAEGSNIHLQIKNLSTTQINSAVEVNNNLTKSYNLGGLEVNPSSKGLTIIKQDNSSNYIKVQK